MKSHLSEEQIAELVTGQSGREAGRHALECAECAAEVERTRQALLQFRDWGYQCADYWLNQRQSRPVRHAGRWIAVAVAMAALLMAVALLHRKPAQQQAQPQEVFLRVPYVVPPAPYERTKVVRMDVPVAALISAGFRMNMPAADSVAADVLLGQDDRPLAVSFPQDKDVRQ